MGLHALQNVDGEMFWNEAGCIKQSFNLTREMCVAVKQNNELTLKAYKMSCIPSQKFICAAPARKFGKSVYRISTDELTNADATLSCREWGGRLASIDN
jgi:hypothetical protein